MRNKAKYKNNKSGYCGVCLHKQTGKWMAYIGLDGNQRNIGLFETAKEAAIARSNAAESIFFTSRHGTR